MLKIRPPSPCGKCPGCLLAAEVRKMLDFVDRRLKPAVFEAAQRVSDARWRRSEEAHKRERRSYSEKLESWMNERARILAPDVVAGMTCTVSTSTFFLEVEVPAPAEVTVRPREVELAPDPGRPRCNRCGGPAEDGLLLPHLTICASCFGVA